MRVAVSVDRLIFCGPISCHEGDRWRIMKHEVTRVAETKKIIKCNTDTGFLKLIAIITMTIDHVGAVIFPDYQILRIIGRIAFPIFAYCIAVGCIYTKNIGKYALRVLLLAILIQPLYVTAMNHQTRLAFDWAHNFFRIDLILQHYYLDKRLAIHFTLFMGILLIWTLRDKKYIATAVVFAVYWYLQSWLDYGMYGVYLIVLFWALIDRPLTSLFWVAAYMVWYGLPTLRTKLWPMTNVRVYVQIYALMALPLIYIPMNTKIKVNKWVFYLFYPAHMAVIYLLSMPK